MGEETSVYKGNIGVSQKGKVMKLLYYTWDEYCSYDIRQCFEQLGYEYRVCSYEMKNKLESAEFTEQLRKLLEEDDYDFIFSFAYFPVIAEAAAANRVKYVSWIYDSPLYSLYTDSVFHKYNYIFHFDSTEVERLKKCGVDHIYHMPLAVNADRLGSLDKEDGFLYDVSFVGKLYRDQYNFFDQIKGMPEYYKGYFDALIQTQMKLFGYNVIADVLTPEEFKKISAFIGFKNDGKMFLDARDMFINILEKKVTAVVGGGDVALEDAIYLSALCEKVYLIHRRDEFRAAVNIQQKVKETPNIEILPFYEIKEIKGDNKVSSIKLVQNKTGEEKELEVSGVFVAVGMKPVTDIFKDYVELDKTGYIKAGEDCKTSSEGIFAAGDIRTKPLRQVVTAVADGATAVQSVESCLNRK